MATPILTEAETIEIPYQFNSKSSVEDFIIAEAMKYHYPPMRAVAIARAESGLYINAKNTGSTASGTFQFINGTFKGFCIDKYQLTDTMKDKNNPAVQIKCAVRMLAEGGESHWSESRGVWGKVYGNT